MKLRPSGKDRDRSASVPSGATPVSVTTGRPARSHANVIELRRIVKTYQMGEYTVQALRGVDLTVERGDFLAIMGASGSGKSTLMNIIGCLDVPTTGRFLLDGVDVAILDEDQLATARNRKIGFVFQSFNLIPRTTALANVELPLAYAGVKAKERRDRALAALTIVGMADRAEHLPNEMSGGQQQRCAVARAIATNPALLLADEPTGNLDSKSTKEVLDVFDEMNNQGRTIVMITHEEDVAARAKRVIRLFDGEIVDDRRQRGVHERAGLIGPGHGSTAVGATTATTATSAPPAPAVSPWAAPGKGSAA